MKINDEDKLARFDAVLYEAVGGQEVAAMLGQHHIEGMSIRAVAQVHNLPVATARTRMIRGRQALDRMGLIPKGWKA